MIFQRYSGRRPWFDPMTPMLKCGNFEVILRSFGVIHGHFLLINLNNLEYYSKIFVSNTKLHFTGVKVTCFEKNNEKLGSRSTKMHSLAETAIKISGQITSDLKNSISASLPPPSPL